MGRLQVVSSGISLQKHVGQQTTKNGRVSLISFKPRGEPPPFATLMYVWDSRADVDTVVLNRRSDRVRKIVLESGPAHLGQWRSYERDMRADFRRAFGEDPGALIGVAVQPMPSGAVSKFPLTSSCVVIGVQPGGASIRGGASIGGAASTLGRICPPSMRSIIRPSKAGPCASSKRVRRKNVRLVVSSVEEVAEAVANGTVTGVAIATAAAVAKVTGGANAALRAFNDSEGTIVNRRAVITNKTRRWQRRRSATPALFGVHARHYRRLPVALHVPSLHILPHAILLPSHRPLLHRHFLRFVSSLLVLFEPIVGAAGHARFLRLVCGGQGSANLLSKGLPSARRPLRDH